MHLARLKQNVRRPSARVLVVDDEESIRTLLFRWLEPLGYAVDMASDAISALETMKKSPADVALVDIRMPGPDGVWLIERLQKQYPDTAIVIATGITELDPQLTLRPGVIGYVVKPFALEKVQEIVKEAATMACPKSPRPQLRLCGPGSKDEIVDANEDDGD